jgi:Ca2+-binding RTX toxin-like protein
LHKKYLSILATVAMVVGLLAFAVPAQANHQSPDSVSLFMPQDDYEAKDQLSDQFDGVDSLAHLTAVATTDATSVTFFVCPEGQTPFLDGSGGEDEIVRRNTGCTVAGTDNEGRQPTELDVHGNATSDEAYEAFWNIPQTLDGATRDIFAVACQGAEGTSDTEATDDDVPDNCTQDGEFGIFLEDSSDEDDLIAGEIVGICTAPGSGDEVDNDGDDVIDESDAGTNRCFNDENNDFTTDPAERDFRTDLAVHGGIVPEDGFTLRFRTSDDVTGAGACLAYPADANVDEDEFDQGAPAAEDDFPACDQTSFAAVEQRTNEYIQWVVTFDDAQVPGEDGSDVGDDREMDLAIFGATENTDTVSGEQCPEFDGTFTGFPLGGAVCVLDEHYVVSTERQASDATVTFVVDRQGTANDNDCGNPDRDESNLLGDSEQVRGCLTDQFGDPFPADGNTGSATFESEGPEGSGIFTCPGDDHDHDDDGRIDHCHVTEDDLTANNTDNETGWQITIDNESGDGIDATPGDQTITFCYDPDAPGTETNPGAGAGCADEDDAVTDTLVKHWTTSPTNVELVFAEEGQTNAQACESGDTSKENQVGDTDTLVVCTYDNDGNLASTTPEDNGRLQWRIEPSGGGELTATRFTESPPTETGNDGTTTTDIEAFRQGNDVIEVCLQNDPGGNAGTDCADVQKRVTEGTGTPAQCNDGQDNDGDGRIDFPADPECTSSNDNSEASGGGGPVTSGQCQGFNQGTSTPIAGGDGNVVVGTPDDDVLTGTDGDDIICGLGGDDVISGLGGKDQIVGNGGNDSISGKNGNDVADGGAGNDSLKGNDGIDTLRGRGGRDTLQGGRGEDTALGGAGEDTMRGFSQNDTLKGGKGSDTARGGAGRNDVCRAETKSGCEA